jgi:hypothetical protein
MFNVVCAVKWNENMTRQGKYVNDPQKLSDLKKKIPLELDSALPKSRHYAPAIAAITIAIILIYLKFFNHT